MIQKVVRVGSPSGPQTTSVAELGLVVNRVGSQDGARLIAKQPRNRDRVQFGLRLSTPQRLLATTHVKQTAIICVCNLYRETRQKRPETDPKMVWEKWDTHMLARPTRRSCLGQRISHALTRHAPKLRLRIWISTPSLLGLAVDLTSSPLLSSPVSFHTPTGGCRFVSSFSRIARARQG